MTIGTKEHAFLGLIGRQVGVSIEKFIYEKFRREIIVSLANDTICLTLSGLTKFSAKTVCGGIVGTGMNFAFFLDEKRLVNLEAACFDKFNQTETGKKIDKQSVQRGNSLFEKEVSGASLYQHYNLLTGGKLTSTHELDMVARGEKPGEKTVARDLMKRSAQLIACQAAGIVNFKKQPMNFVMEGSLFWVGWNYKKTVAETIKLLAPDYPVKFVAIPDCGIVGAAKLLG